MADVFKQYLPPKQRGDSNDCTECGHPYEQHKVYPGGKCAKCCDPKKGFSCNGFNLGDTVAYDVEDDPITGRPWKVSKLPGKKLKDGNEPAIA